MTKHINVFIFNFPTAIVSV